VQSLPEPEEALTNIFVALRRYGGKPGQGRGIGKPFWHYFVLFLMV
jgi:hypothetical protein